MGRIAKSNAEVFKYLDEGNKDFFVNASKYQKKFYTNPYSEEAKSRIRDANLEEVFINIFQPHIKTLVGMMASNKNQPTAIPMGKDPKYAYLYQVVLNAFFQMNSWNLIYPQILTNQFLIGIGFAMVDKDDGFTKNPFGATVRSLDPTKCRWSRTFSHPLMDDLDLFAYYNVMPVKSAIVKSGLSYKDDMMDSLIIEAATFPEDFLESATLRNINQPHNKTENTEVPWIEVYRKEFKNYHKLLYKDQNRSELIEAKTDNAMEDAMSYFYTEQDEGALSKFMGARIQSEKIGLKTLKFERVVKRVCIGGLDVGDFTLPSSHFPFVPFIYDMPEHGNPHGAAESIDGLSAAINNSLLLLLLNARLQTIFRTKTPRGSVKDSDQLMQQWAVSGGNIEYDPITPGNSTTAIGPEAVFAQPLPNTFSDIIQLLIQLAEYTTSVTSSLQGNAPPYTSGITLNTLNQFGGLKFKPYADKNQSGLSRVGKVVVDYIRENSDYDQIIRYKEEDESFRSQIAVPNMENSPMEASMDEIGNPNTKSVARQVDYPGFNVEMPMNWRKQNGKKDEDDIEFINDMKDAEADVNIVITATASTDNIREQWANDMRIAIQQYPQITPAILEELLKVNGYPWAERVGKKVESLKSLQDKLAGMEEQLKDANNKNANLMAQTTSHKMEADATRITEQYRSKLDKLYNKIQAAADSMKTGAPAEDVNKLLLDALSELDAEVDAPIKDAQSGSVAAVETIQSQGV